MSQALIPALLIAGVLLLFFGIRDAVGRAPVASVPTNWRIALFVPLFLLMLRYVMWRVTETIPEPSWTPEGIWPLVFLAFELSAMLMLCITYLTLSRRTDRVQEVDRNLHLLDGTAYRVALFIPTYNEPKAVLQRTILGAMSQQYPGVQVHVLDDKRRDWLRDYCDELGVGYLTRTDNAGAKAGNMNAGLATLRARGIEPDFIGVLDADFVARPDFISRTLVLHLLHPEAGIVQTPQHFFNPDPVQMNLALTGIAPDEQRFFFDELMPSKDAWGTAFCCGTSSLIRVAALDRIGGFPTESVTEDMLMSLRMREAGWQTVYLNEPVTTGLAPEGLGEYVTQRHRWCLGFMQIFRDHYNPFSPRHRLGFMDRLHVLDTFMYWALSFPTRYLFLLAPGIYWVTGWLVIQASMPEILFYLAPWLVAHMTVMSWISRGSLQPILNDVTQLLVVPAAIHASVTGLFSRAKHKFTVTPKGELGDHITVDWQSMRPMLVLGAINLAAITMAAFPDFRPTLPFEPRVVNLFWLVINLMIIALGALSCVELPRKRGQERFHVPSTLPAALDLDDGTTVPVHLVELSLSGCRVRPDQPMPMVGSDLIGREAHLEITASEIYHLRIARITDATPTSELGCQFQNVTLMQQLLLTNRIFAEGHARLAFSARSFHVMGEMLRNLLGTRGR